MPAPGPPAPPSTVDEALLDSYSQTVSWVARELLPSVAALRVGDAGRQGGAGSAVVLSADGMLVTSAHVVQAWAGGRRRSPPARRSPSRWWGWTG